MATARAVTGRDGGRLYGGLDMNAISPVETQGKIREAEKNPPVLVERKVGDLLGGKYDAIVRFVMNENESMRLTDFVYLGRNPRSPIVFLETENGRKYRQNGVRFYEVKNHGKA